DRGRDGDAVVAMALEPPRPLLWRLFRGEPLVDLLDALDVAVIKRLGDRPDERKVALASEEHHAVGAGQVLYRMGREDHRRAGVGEAAQQPQQLAGARTVHDCGRPR